MKLVHPGLKSRQRGFNMIEVLIASIVLAVGLLGIAGLQLAGVRANQGSYFRSQASAIMLDMIERIHNNRAGADVGAYAGMTSGGTCPSVPTLCVAENGASSTNCTAAQMAAYDRYVIVCGVRGASGARVDSLAQMLPTGTLTVDCLNSAGTAVAAGACPAGSRHRVTVTWTELTQADSANAGQVLAQVQTVSTTIQP